MNQDNIEEIIWVSADISKLEARRFMRALKQTIIAAISQGDSVKIDGFGTIKIVTRRARLRNNFHALGSILVPAHPVVVWQYSNTMLTVVNTPIL